MCFVKCIRSPTPFSQDLCGHNLCEVMSRCLSVALATYLGSQVSVWDGPDILPTPAIESNKRYMSYTFNMRQIKDILLYSTDFESMTILMKRNQFGYVFCGMAFYF